MGVGVGRGGGDAVLRGRLKVGGGLLWCGKDKVETPVVTLGV